MKAFGRRKILSLSTLVKVLYFIPLSLAIIYTLTVLLRSEQNHKLHLNEIEQPEQPNLHLPRHTACPAASVLNSKAVKMYSNRILDKQYYLTIGIPTLVRKETSSDYLIKTLNSLITEYRQNDSSIEILIVLLIADRDILVKNKVAERVYSLFGNFVRDGILDIIQVPADFYPKTNTPKRRFGDTKERVNWRSKQVLDYSFLFCYCYGLAKYHLQLEDDVIACPYYLPKLQYFIQNYENNTTWFTLDASLLGYIGKVYHNSHLQELASYFLLFFDEMPVDWLEYSWRDLKGQHPRFNLRVSSLFQHIGIHSSLNNKTQRISERYFDEFSHKFLGLNPPAILFSDLEGKRGTKPENAYNKGGGYFWATCQNKDGCYLKIIFKEQLKIKKIYIATSGNTGVLDKITNGTLITGTGSLGKDCLDYDNTKPIEKFNPDGQIYRTFTNGLQVNCLKFVIQKHEHWVLIREIDIWTT